MRKAYSDKVRKVQRRSRLLTTALNRELVDVVKRDGDEQFEERRRIHEEALSLQFISEEKGMADKDIQDKIEREVTKTKEQKLEDLRRVKPALPMAGGGPNDFL